jgi:hypothetical protein
VQFLEWVEPGFMQRASHVVDGWVIDPVYDEHELARVTGAVGVVQLLDRHNRDCARVAELLGVPLYVVPDEAPAGAPFEVLPVLHRKRWHEVALWFPEHRTLVCADALGTARYYRAPSERIAVSPLLRLTPPRVLLRVDPEHVLVGHGEGLHEDAASAVLAAVTKAPSRTLPWLWAALRDWGSRRAADRRSRRSSAGPR